MSAPIDDLPRLPSAFVAGIAGSRRVRQLTVLALVALLAGCGAPQVPRPGAGVPAAQLNDRVTEDDDGSNSRVFAVLELDGVPVRNALLHSRTLGWGAGAGFAPYLVARFIEAKPVKVRIAGRYVYGAPIQGVLRELRGNNAAIEGVVELQPQADKVYRVNGSLVKGHVALWIEDFDTGLPVTRTLVEGD